MRNSGTRTIKPRNGQPKSSFPPEGRGLELYVFKKKQNINPQKMRAQPGCSKLGAGRLETHQNPRGYLNFSNLKTPLDQTETPIQ